MCRIWCILVGFSVGRNLLMKRQTILIAVAAAFAAGFVVSTITTLASLAGLENNIRKEINVIIPDIVQRVSADVSANFNSSLGISDDKNDPFSLRQLNPEITSQEISYKVIRAAEETTSNIINQAPNLINEKSFVDWNLYINFAMLICTAMGTMVSIFSATKQVDSSDYNKSDVEEIRRRLDRMEKNV